MGSKTKIEWTSDPVTGEPGATWNPVKGCSRVSEGCRNCYAERMAARFSTGAERVLEKDGDLFITNAGPFAGFAEMTDSGPRWTGKVELDEKKMSLPMRWRKPRRIFVNSMSDLFHERLSDADIFSVFSVMGKCPAHTFMILTKRPQRMQEFLSRRRWRNLGHSPAMGGNHYVSLIPGEHRLDDSLFLPNVWLGVSVEDQAAADERIPLLLRTPAALRFVSVEPMLGPVNAGLYLRPHWTPSGGEDCFPYLDWVICGGESGPGARPMHPNWALVLRDQCVAAKVPFFFKQWGETAPAVHLPLGAMPEKSIGPERCRWMHSDGRVAEIGRGETPGNSWSASEKA